MSDNDRNLHSGDENIVGNLSPEIPNVENPFVPLGYPPSPAEPLNWNQPPFIPDFNSYPPNPEIPLSYGGLGQFNPSYDYLSPTINEYNRNVFNNLKYNLYEVNQGNSSNCAPFHNEFMYPCQSEPLPRSASPTHHLIENLVGNWVPNTTGTYSPFGNVEPFTNGVFENTNNFRQMFEDQTEEKQFQFNRGRKPRMVAEVKPMRPSYSDVLAKSVPQVTVKPSKVDPKENKPKKDNKKNGNKSQRINPSLSRSNTNNDIKDVPVVDKIQFNKSTDSKPTKSSVKGPLNRRWASLDNINEPLSSKTDDKKKKAEEFPNKSVTKNHSRKLSKSDVVDVDASGGRSEIFYAAKNGVKKVNKLNTRQKSVETGGGDRPVGKRNLRKNRRENQILFGIYGQKAKQYLKEWWKIITVFVLWLFHLISDICSLSVHISRHMAISFWNWLTAHWALFTDTILVIAGRIRFITWIKGKFKKADEKTSKENNRSFLHSGLQNNINMPTTGEEAMKRLLACKGKDPYSILGVTPTCTDDDIKRYYKRQAFLVHPDKNQQPGAEEAFKILVHAFDMIGEPERRAAYDKGVVESVQVEQAWSELTELLAQLQQKVEAAANTIRCSACGLRHKRIKVERPSYAARNCSSCKIHHAAREGDIWAEARCFGFLWHYYACMEGGVYDITEWAACQKDSLKHLKPDSHQVQYRIALGKQSNQPRRHSGSPRNEKPPDLENLLNTLYGQTDGAQQGMRRKNKKGNK